MFDDVRLVFCRGVDEGARRWGCRRRPPSTEWGAPNVFSLAERRGHLVVTPDPVGARWGWHLSHRGRPRRGAPVRPPARADRGCPPAHPRPCPGVGTRPRGRAPPPAPPGPCAARVPPHTSTRRHASPRQTYTSPELGWRSTDVVERAGPAVERRHAGVDGNTPPLAVAAAHTDGSSIAPEGFLSTPQRPPWTGSAPTKRVCLPLAAHTGHGDCFREGSVVSPVSHGR